MISSGVDAAKRALSAGELARRSGVAVSAVHFYERKGLIWGWRSGGNQRRYERAMLRRIAIIKVAQQLGIPLADIGARLARLPAERTPGKADWTQLAAEWRADLDGRIARLVRLRDDMDGCIGCGCLSIETCPLRNPGDMVGREGGGARYLEPPPSDRPGEAVGTALIPGPGT